MPRHPIQDIEEMLDRMGRQFEQTRMTAGGEIATAAIDVIEWDGDYIVEADLPGFEREDIDIHVTDHTLHITAEHKAEPEERGEEEEMRYLRQERVKTDIHREIRLPEEVDEKDASATYENGVLTVTLPKAAAEEEEEGHQIEIR